MEIKDCPRCGEPIPNREHAGMYAGAISRQDNKTEICSECGVMEAMNDFARQPQCFTDELVKGVLLSDFAGEGGWKNVGIDNDYSAVCHPIGFTDCFMEVEGEGFTSRLSRRDIVRGVKFSAMNDGQIRKMWRDGFRNGMYFFTAEMGSAIMERACELKWEEEHEDLMYPNTIVRWTLDGTQRIS